MIKRIHLQQNPNKVNDFKYSREVDFGYMVWYITEYISRDLAKQKYKYEKAYRLIIDVDHEEDLVLYKEIFKCVSYYSASRGEEIIFAPENQKAEKILDVIIEAAQAYDALIPGVQKTIHDSIEAFRQGGYKNIWEFKRRRVKGIGNAKLECELTPKEFILRLIVENKEGVIHNQEILKTLPDSIFYHHHFKDLKVDDTHIHVYNRDDKVLFELSINNIGQNNLEKLVISDDAHSVFANQAYKEQK